ncbi:MAG: HepT-like ribonuclease domain-containing protein [Candidatus Dormibacteria bacterium]
MSDEAQYLGWIRDSLARVREAVETTPDGVLEDGLLRDGIIWRLETIGEATTHLTPELKARHPEIPWRDITGFRNIAAHGYLVIRAERLAQIVRDDLGPLQAVVEDELQGR